MDRYLTGPSRICWSQRIWPHTVKQLRPHCRISFRTFSGHLHDCEGFVGDTDSCQNLQYAVNILSTLCLHYHGTICDYSYDLSLFVHSNSYSMRIWSVTIPTVQYLHRFRYGTFLKTCEESMDCLKFCPRRAGFYSNRHSRTSRHSWNRSLGIQSGGYCPKKHFDLKASEGIRAL